MIRNAAMLRQFEDDLVRTSGVLPVEKSFEICSSLWKEAVNLGIMPPKEPLEGIDVDIRIARVLHTCSKR